jgi:hypothetical protein
MRPSGELHLMTLRSRQAWRLVGRQSGRHALEHVLPGRLILLLGNLFMMNKPPSKRYTGKLDRLHAVGYPPKNSWGIVENNFLL